MALNSLTIAQQGIQDTPYLIAVQGLGDTTPTPPTPTTGPTGGGGGNKKHYKHTTGPLRSDPTQYIKGDVEADIRKALNKALNLPEDAPPEVKRVAAEIKALTGVENKSGELPDFAIENAALVLQISRELQHAMIEFERAKVLNHMRQMAELQRLADEEDEDDAITMMLLH